MIHTHPMGAPRGVPTLLAHCFLGNSGMWRPLIAALSPAPDALAIDLPGHGASPMPDLPCDLQAVVADHLQDRVQTPVLLIGHSFGGASMLRFALRNPGLVRGMVLFEPVFIAAALAEPDFDPAAHEDRYAEAARQGHLAEAARDFFTYNDPTRDWDALPPQAQALMTRQMALLPATEPGVVHDSGALLTPGLMEGFAPPVLLIGGDRSPPLFPAIIRGLARRLHQAESVIIPGAGHMVPLTHADPCARAIDDWRARHGLL